MPLSLDIRIVSITHYILKLPLSHCQHSHVVPMYTHTDVQKLVDAGADNLLSTTGHSHLLIVNLIKSFLIEILCLCHQFSVRVSYILCSVGGSHSPG